MSEDDGSREEVPMAAEPADAVDAVTLSMPRSRDWTWHDLQDIPDDGHRYEIVDGSLYVSPGPSRPHQVATSRLVRILHEPLQVRRAELVGPRRRG